MTSKNSIKKTVLVLLALAAVGAGVSSRAAEDDRIPFPKPGSHRANWMEYHGRAVGAEGNSPGQPGKACLTCHERTDCITCHNTTMPRDHNNTWRVRGHGLMADGNRERCLICHRQDYCIRCHSETAPRSHTASWRKRHCTWCHLGPGFVPADNCVVCHKQAPHTSAPHAVSPSMNCRLCHT
jgi:hypothetical protein